MKYLVALIFFLLPGKSSSQTKDFKGLDLTRADSIASLHAHHPLKDPKRLTLSLIENVDTEFERFRVIFKWITNNISYDTELFHEKISKERRFARNKKRLKKWQAGFSKKLDAHLLKKKRSICEGYARLLNVMCTYAGIECAVITGHARNDYTSGRRPNHAWNAVKINGKWYLTDPTWASGFADYRAKNFTRQYNKLYFLSDPDRFIADHYPSDKSWTLLLDKPSLDEFYSSPVKYEGFNNNEIVQCLPARGNINIGQGGRCTFQFTANQPVMAIATEEIGKKIKAISHNYSVAKNPEGYYSIDYTFSERGQTRFYIFVNQQLTLAYDIIVK